MAVDAERGTAHKLPARLGAQRRFAYLRRRPFHAIYHPHQRLWNSYASALANRLHLRGPLILADSFLLLMEAMLGRIRKRGFASLFSRHVTSDRIIYLFDLGLHRDAKQIGAVLDWFGKNCPVQIFGFEAHPDYFASASEVLKERGNVTLVNAAVVAPGCRAEHVPLYLSGGSGTGDSICSERSGNFILVPAIHLSDFIREMGLNLESNVAIIRMNIEGAEWGVIEDLARADRLKHFDGFFGSWDDIYKVDPWRDEAFRALLRRHRISSFPFNDRDLGNGAAFRLRELAIRYALRTCMLPKMRGQARSSDPKTSMTARRP